MKHVYAFIASLLLTACGNSDGGFSGGAFNRTDETPAGEFSVSKTNTPFNSQNCNYGVYSLDQRVRPGFTRKSTFTYLGDNGKLFGQGAISTSTVDQVNLKKQSIVVTSRLEGSGYNLQSSSTCTMGGGQSYEDMDCQKSNVSTGVIQYANHKPDFTYCYIAQSNSTLEDTNEVGTYKFRNGASVFAMKSVYRSEGTISCFDQDGKSYEKGTGRSHHVIIRTFDYPSVYGFSDGCSPESIFNYHDVRDKDGNAVSFNRSETIEVSL